MEGILEPLQKMYIILCLAEGMRAECAGKEELKSDYQIHSRIYANAFASMIRYGVWPACETRDGMAFLTMRLEGRIYSCPARTVKNIMKVDFAFVEEKLPEIVLLIREEEARLAAESKNSGKKKQEPIPKSDISTLMPQEARAISAVKPEEISNLQEPQTAEDAGMGKAMKSGIGVQKKEAIPAPDKIEEEKQPMPDTMQGPVTASVGTDIQEEDAEPATSEAAMDLTATDMSMALETNNDSLRHMDTVDSGGFYAGDAVTHAFQRKQVLKTLKEEQQPQPVLDAELQKPARQADRSAGGVTDTAVKSPLGRFSRFFPKNKKQEVLGTMPSLLPQQMKTETVPDIIPHVEEEKRGERICHTHYVMLRKTYGTQVTGPYVIQVWPTEVIEMCLERIPSGIFVRAQAPNGTVICKVNEGHTKYIVLDIDNKQFNVFGYWEAGRFITEVGAINKTASIYTMSEEVEQECPEHVSDMFLDQFRSREPHRPEFFVMPLGNSIPDSGTVPIAAFIRVRDKNYPVTSKGPGETLRFTYEGQLSEISGWWEDGRFVFVVRAVREE